MTFKNYVCWRSEQVQRIMNVEATQPLDHIFLATHYPIAMKRGELIKGESQICYSEEEFLKDFLATADFAFVPVLGESGTGKSHLIRWLAANIESTDKRKVLLIPKIGTNLKDIIALILNIEGIEGKKLDEYRQRLHQATSTLTEVQARIQLLNQLAVVVGNKGKRDRSQLTDEQNYLVDELDSLLYDPFFREHWLKDGGIIHRLVIHTLGRQDTVEVIEERREFSIDDLPLNILYLQKAGQQAQNFYRFLIDNDSIQKATVEWLNCHLDEAMTQVLSLGREDLQRLMREVRETLAENGIELVLLIEDFAKLQGIDLEVLEAVLAQPQQPGSKLLCAMRTALACTTGYYNGLVKRFDTVLQRVTFSVNLDLGAVSNQSLVTEEDIQKFVARYLNAVRLKDEEIRNWANARKEDGVNRIEPPSFCDTCEYRQACHAGFGEVKGISLYPFTPNALKQMLSRVNPGNFNPRILIKDVLKYTLENSVTDIQQGRFPSVSLREHFGKMRLTAIVQAEIRAKDSLNASRREVLLDLWTGNEQLVDLPTEVHTAFNLPPLGITVQKIDTKSVVTEKATIYRTERKPSSDTENILDEKLAKQLAILDNWNNRAILPQEIEKPIREFIYPAVIEHIEWDTEMLLRGNFASSSQIFKQRNVLVHSPRVRGEGAKYLGILLYLPLNPDDENEFRETAIAFQGILQYSHYKHWQFPNSDRYFRAYAKQLEKWTQYVLEQIRRRPRESGEPWNPVPAAVELLAIAARMSGHSTNSLEELINALFLELDDKDEANREKAWKELFKFLQRNQSKLLEIVTSRIVCTKGSSSQFQIIDAIQIIAPLKEVCKDWQPKCEIPQDLREEYKVITKVRQKVDELLLKAIEEERDRQLGIYQSLVAEFGEEFKKKELIYTVENSINKAREAGIFGQKSAEILTSVIASFQRTRFSGYIDTMRRLKIELEKLETNSSKLLHYLSENHQKAMNDASEFLKETNSFLDTSILRAENDVYQLQSAVEQTVESSCQSLENELAKLHSLLAEIKG